MLIRQIINNNVVSSIDGDKEIVLMGRGIAFQKKRGDAVDESRIEKYFLLADEKQRAYSLELLEHIPPVIIEIASDAIDQASAALSTRLADAACIALADHIDMAVGRCREGIETPNPMLWDIKHFYQKEFTVAQDVLKMIDERLGIALPEGEAGFIALHFVNASLGSKMEEVAKITTIIHSVLGIIRYRYKVPFDEDSIAFQRLITHVRFFAQRYIAGDSPEGPVDEVLLSMIRERYPEAFACAEAIGCLLIKEYGRELPLDEAMYLTMHIEKLQRSRKQ